MALATAPEPERDGLTAEDRCDSCGARAKTVAFKPDLSSVLLFCLHHANKNAVALLSGGWSFSASGPGN